MDQGDVYWYAMAAPDHRRPVVVLTRRPALDFLTSVTVAPVTTRRRETPTYVEVGTADGMPRESAVNLDNIQTVVRDYLGEYITHLSPQRMAEVRRAILFALGMERMGR